MKNYNKTKPIRIEEFDVETGWQGSEAEGFAGRVEGEFAWKVSIEAIKAAGFNLDQANPHAGPAVGHNPHALLAENRRLQAEAQGIRDQLKSWLGSALARQWRHVSRESSMPLISSFYGVLVYLSGRTPESTTWRTSMRCTLATKPCSASRAAKCSLGACRAGRPG